jgi:hypothetical protein
MKLTAALAGIAIAALVTGCATTAPTTTSYYLYNQPVVGGSQDSGKGASSPNTLKLVEVVGADRGTIRITGQIPDSCLTGELDVVIERTAEEMVLLPEPTMSSCYRTRIHIRRDGKGGYVERKALKAVAFANPWPDFDWGLTPR